MSLPFGCCCKRNKPSKRVVVHHQQELYQLIYDLLEEMPPELIDIITSYCSHELRGRCIRTYSDKNEPTCMTTLADGRFVTGHQDGTIQLWDTEAQKIQECVKGDLVDLSTLLQLTNGQLIIGGFLTGNRIELPKTAIQSWNVASKIPSAATAVAQCPFIISVLEQTQDKLIIVLDDAFIILNLTTGKPEQRIERGPREIKNALKTATGQLILATDEGLEWWNLEQGNLIKETNVIKRPYSLAELQNGHLIVNDESKVLEYDPRANTIIKKLGSHNNAIHAILVHSSGNIATADITHTIKLWDPKTDECKDTMEQNHVHGTNQLIELNSGRIASLAVGDIHHRYVMPINSPTSVENTIRIWN
jgi:WD40 repeat protein